LKLALDHVFILTEVGAPTAEKLLSVGMTEGPGRVHKGQGTANRRFEFINGFLELLWVHDKQEAMAGPGSMLRFAERANQLNDNACPFGVILCPEDNAMDLPFSGWSYQPDYFDPPMAFHVGGNSELLEEPLCIYAPFFSASSVKLSPSDGQNKLQSQVDFARISHIKLSVACRALSDQLQAANFASGLQIIASDEHLMELTFDHARLGMRKDFRPDLPLIINW